MKKLLVAIFCFSLIVLNGCGTADKNQASGQPQTPPVAEQPTPPADNSGAQKPGETTTPQQPADQQPKEEEQNEFFKEITTKKIKEDEFEVKGKAKVFEGVLNYVVEDGHNELAEGSAKASKGAPEWGDFSFTLKVKKDTPNSTLMLILFAESPKDGKRVGELPIALPEK